MQSKVEDDGRFAPIFVIARAARRSNPQGRMDCHSASRLAMTEFPLFLITSGLAGSRAFMSGAR
jgi:hypothetical protein